MGSRFAKGKRDKRIANVHKMKDIVRLGWMLGKQHQSVLLESLRQYNAEHISCAIITFLAKVFKQTVSRRCIMHSFITTYFHFTAKIKRSGQRWYILKSPWWCCAGRGLAKARHTKYPSYIFACFWCANLNLNLTTL